MRAWQQWAARGQRGITRPSRALRAPAPHGILRNLASVSKYPTNDEASVMSSDEDLSDRDASHLVCGKCSAPVSKTQDLVFFKWRSGIHVSCMTEAPLQHLRTDTHWNNDEHAWKKHKLHCLKCDHAVGSIARVYNSDKILFSAREVAIQMPEHQSPMISLSGYPSSMLGFSMWSELLLMLESQPNLKSQLQIRRVDNIRDFSVEKKEINTLLLLASDLKSLLDVVDKHIAAMNHVNILTALRRASVLIAAKKKTAPPTSTPRFSVKSEAPEDLLMNLPVHALVNPKAQKAATEALNKRLWKLVDSVESIMNFGIGAVQNPLQLTSLASALWRLNIGRSSILRPLSTQMIKLVNEEAPGLNAHEASLIASAAAHLSSKEIRNEPWMHDVLFAAAGVVLKDTAVFEDKVTLHDIVLPLARSFALTGQYHEEFLQRVFKAVNNGFLENSSSSSSSSSSHPSHGHSAVKSWQARVYQIHLDNKFAQRGSDVMLDNGERLEKYRAAFAGYEKQQKNALFRIRHLVASALEKMDLMPSALHVIGSDGYIVDIALPRQKIAIEINLEDAYQARDPRNDGPAREAGGNGSIFDHEFHTTLPFADLKARHLEHQGWIVVQLHADEFMEITDQDKRIEYLSMLIEIATYSRAEALLAEEEEDEPKPQK